MEHYKYFIIFGLCLLLITNCDVKLPQDEESFEYNEGLTVYSGQTNQDQLIWFVIEKDILKKLHFTYKKETGARSWGRGSDTLAIIVNNKFEYNHDNDFIIIGNKIAGEKFEGAWKLLYPTVDTGNWEAEKTKSLVIRIPHDKIENEATLSVGDSVWFNIECGIRPYHILKEPSADIATISGESIDVEYFTIHAVSAGETSITFTDSSYPEKLEGKLDIKVVN